MLLVTKVFIGSSATLAVTVIFGFLLFPYILRIGVRDQTALRKRNEVRGFYLKLPIPLLFSVYFFNVTNPLEVQEGAKPILREVGPYSYDLWKEKVDIIDNEAEDSLTYSPFDLYTYNEQKSGRGLSQNDYVTILHPVIVGVVTQVVRDTPNLLPIVAKAMNSIFKNPQSIYLTVRVRDILFDGVLIDCSVTDFSAKAVCNQLKIQAKDLLTDIGKKMYTFSLLGPRNQTLGKRVKVLRGIKKSKDLGKLIEFDGKKELKLWSTKECNRFRGTDGWIFPPLMEKEEGLWSFSTDLCRTVGAQFAFDLEYEGLQVRKYFADLGDQEHNVDEKCYCATPKTCLSKNLMDLGKCMGVPIIASLPHFLDSDPSFLDDVIGLKPDKENHSIGLIFEPMTGTPMKAAKRMQFNLPIKPNPKVAFMENIPELLHPMFWVQEGVTLEGALLKKITGIFLLLKLFRVFTWIVVVASLAGMAISGYLYSRKKQSFKITPVHVISKLFNGKSDKVEEFQKETPSTNSVRSRIGGNREAAYINKAVDREQPDKF